MVAVVAPDRSIYVLTRAVTHDPRDDSRFLFGALLALWLFAVSVRCALLWGDVALPTRLTGKLEYAALWVLIGSLQEYITGPNAAQSLQELGRQVGHAAATNGTDAASMAASSARARLSHAAADALPLCIARSQPARVPPPLRVRSRRLHVRHCPQHRGGAACPQ